MTPCPAHIARHTIRKGFAPDAPANAADRRTYSSALPAGAVTPQRRAWQSSLLHDARHSRAFFMPGRSAQLLAAVPRVPGRQQRTETIRRRPQPSHRSRTNPASNPPQSAVIHRNPPQSTAAGAPGSKGGADTHPRAARHKARAGAGATGRRSGAGSRPRAARHKSAGGPPQRR